MANKVVVNLESLPKGEKVEVLYLGVFDNGATHDLTDEQVVQYEAASRKSFPESGYIFAGKPHGEAQKTAYEKNVKAEAKTEPQENDPATQISGGISDSTKNTVEGSDK